MMVRIACLCVLLGLLQAADAALDTIVPLPKEAQAAGPEAPLEGFRIVVADDEKARIGAEEINQRVVSLGGQALPIEPLGDASPEGRAIVISPCEAATGLLTGAGVQVTPGDPGEQGYAIHPQGEGETLRLWLIGSDPLGTLYAAVTARQLVVRRDGTLWLQPASIRDWPDYKHRMNGTPFAEHLRGRWYDILSAEAKGDLGRARALASGWVAQQKRYYDWMLRAKINMAWDSTNITPGDAPEQTTVVRQALREVHEYGLARGIEAMDGDTTAIGRYPADKDNTDVNGCVFSGSHGRYYCWSRLDYHKRRAERAAKWLSDCGYRGYYVHATDSGGWQNPALWDNRCEECRRNYGDDHAKADATVFRVYYDAARRAAPDLRFVAVVYPYTGRYLDPEYVYRSAAEAMGEGEAARTLAEATVRKLTGFLTSLDALLPPDMLVCIRESERHHLDLARRAWGDRPFHLYYEYAYWKGMRPYFVTTPLWTRSLYYPTHDDILFGNVSGLGWQEFTQLLGVECAWNVDRPGAADFDSGRWHDEGLEAVPSPERVAFAQRAARFWFGEKAGPLIAPAFAENISHYFICFPDEVTRYMRIDDPAATMREQAAAARRAASSLDQLWALQQQAPVLKGYDLGYFLNLYVMTHSAAIVAQHRAHMLSAQEAIRRGDRQTVQDQLTQDRAELEAAAPEWTRRLKAVPQRDLLATPLRKTAPAGYLSTLDVPELRKECDDLWDRREVLLAAHAVPEWFERSCRTRTVTAAPVATPITVDGVLDEPAWASALLIEHFVDYRVLRLEGLETHARLLYDGEHLYVGFECFDPAAAEITAFLPGPDEHALSDSVEVLIAPNAESQEFTHWIVDAHGTVFDARNEVGADGMPRYDVGWDGTAQVGVASGEGRWTVEMAIPAGDLGLKLTPGREYRALLCRNIVHTRLPDETESNAILFLDGDGFRTVSKFARLELATGAQGTPPPQVEMTLNPLDFDHEVTGDGAGTRIDGDLRIETDRNLHKARVIARCTDGVDPVGEFELGGAPLVQLRWQPEKPFSVLIPRELPGVVCTVEVTSDEGAWSFQRRSGSPRRAPVPREALFAPGMDGQALAHPAFFPSANPMAIQLEEGTIEFWLCPDWDVAPRAAGPRGSLEHTFLNMSPIRPDYPYLSNVDSLTISAQNSGFLLCTIANSDYQSRSVQASVREWRRGDWHHVALQWKLDAGGTTAMALYIDGKLASDRSTAGGKDGADDPLAVRQKPLPIQIGSMNTGFRPAEAAIDELRISSARRYAGPFTPARRVEPDADTLALFHFDGTTSATVPDGLSVTPGPVR